MTTESADQTCLACHGSGQEKAVMRPLTWGKKIDFKECRVCKGTGRKEGRGADPANA